MTNDMVEIRSLLEKSLIDSDAKWIAFSGGLDSSIVAKIQSKKNINGMTIITKDFVGTDLAYSQITAKHLGINLKLKYAEISDMLNAITETVKILKNFNDIEIRNSIVSYLYLSELKKNNISTVITGDGADEIFAGYNFLIQKDHAEIKNELKRMKEIMHFPSQKIANELGMSIEMPFIDENVIKIAETLSIDSLVNKKDGVTFGKWILRKAFENDLPSSIVWRQKTPMQDGSGTAALTKLFESIITDEIFMEKSKKIKNEDGVTIRTKESLHYYETYRKEFEIPESKNEINSCPDCNSEIADNSKFCRMCGKFPLT
jgi:asparagine synthase (glutamine-hydrolysing)